MKEVNGVLTVKLTPEDTGDARMGLMRLDKTYHGELEATGRGRMLTAMTDVNNSAVYVAVEQVTGTLDGREGSCLISHHGTMEKGQQTLVIKTVPDSGTGDWAGINGEMGIRITDGKHSYTFAYLLPPKG